MSADFPQWLWRRPSDITQNEWKKYKKERNAQIGITTPMSLAEKKHSILDRFEESIGQAKCNPTFVATNATASINYIRVKEWATTEEKETTMTEFDIIREQRDKLLSRARATFFDGRTKLEEEFGLRAKRPATYKEAVDILKAGTYTLDLPDETEEDDYNEFDVSSFWWSVNWYGIKVDRKGYQAALKDYEKQYNDLTDTIQFKDVDTGFAALEEFKKLN